MNKIFGHSMPEFIDILERNGSIDGMYSALQSDDLADAVMAALPIINDTRHFEIKKYLDRKVKCAQMSEKFRLKGNEDLQRKWYRKTLIWYNLALLYAPTNTESMILALSNRSQLLLEIGAKDECLKDIERCQTMECSEEIKRKLEARKVNCRGSTSMDIYSTADYKFAREYFKFDVSRHKDIPSVSDDVNVVKDNGVTKIVAARDIEVGKVIAIEPAFVGTLHNTNYFTSCHYCHKMSLNLMPCDGCCVALFCDENCMKQSNKMYHKIECQVIDIIESMSATAKCKLPVVAALKIREMSDSWEDFINISLKIGRIGMEESSINEICDHKNKRSLLNFNDDKHFVYGKTFNQCFVYAIIIKYLGDIPDYLPQDLMNRTAAQRALARIMLSLYVKFPLELDIQNCILNKFTQDIQTEPEPNMGLFSFASKLTHSCSPNLFAVGLGNKLALIAVKSIKKGTELTVSFIGHWAEAGFEEVRSVKLFLEGELKCQCRVCIEDWNPVTEEQVLLSNEEKRCYNDFYSKTLHFRFFNIITWNQFIETCRALEVFQNSKNTREYMNIFRMFRNNLVLFQYLSSRNCSL